MVNLEKIVLIHVYNIKKEKGKMKKFILLVIICLFICVNAIAGSTYSGIHIGTFKGNDSNSDIESLINNYFITENILYETDIKETYKLENNEAGGLGDFYFNWTDNNKSGKWYNKTPINFYSVKGGSQFALYWMKNPVLNGFFSTEHLIVGKNNQPDLSHITIYINKNNIDLSDIIIYNKNNGSTNVPESSTLLLFGSGLLLLLLSFYKRKK
jgi:hypothetical protein